MILYGTQFSTIRPMRSFPRLMHIISERRSDASYHYEGKVRQSERQCLFKYTLSGRGVFRDEAGEHSVTTGKGFLCEVCDARTAYYYPADAEEPWEYIYVCFDGPAATEMTREMVARCGSIYELPSDGPAITQLTDWEQYGLGEREISPAVGARIVMDMLTTLAQSRQADAQDDPGNQLVRRVQKIIYRHLKQNLNITELADMLEVSREHLTRVFKEQTSQSPYQYLLRQKMILACRLLKDTTLSNKEIARQLGYDAPGHFTRTFKQVMRMTPSRFRQDGVVPIE